MVLEVDYSELLSNLMLKPFNMLLETEEIRKELFVLYGFLEFQQHYFLWKFLTADLLISFQANVKLDRKSLAGIAFSDPETFKKIVEKVRV